MVCDHVGMILFPSISILRDIGRLSFPIFAFLIAEGAKRTRNKLRHLLTMAGFAAVIQICYFIYDRSLEMSVLITFTLSLLLIYALDFLKEEIFAEKTDILMIIVSSAALVGAAVLAITLDHLVDLDYGLSGCFLPLCPSLLNQPKSQRYPESLKKLDCNLMRVAFCAVGTLGLSFDYGGTQFLSLLAIPLLLLYSEKRGKLNLKYFFYVFYPLHLVLIFGISLLLK